jgi:hypothetical protein
MLVAVLSMACSEGSTPTGESAALEAPIHVTVAKSTYAPGQQVTLTFANRSGRAYHLSPCIRDLERDGLDGWKLVAEGERWCQLSALVLPGWSAADAATDLPPSLETGAYRFRYWFMRASGRPDHPETQVSSAFTVTP